MKILLTGYTGLLGRHIARKLKDSGYWVRVLLHAKAVTKRELGQEVDDYIFGAMDDEVIIKEALKDIDIVIHSGWKFSPNNVEFPTINETATKFLFEESRKCGVKKFVFLSSISVYGMHKSVEKLNEASELASGSELMFAYPKEKITLEKMLKENSVDSMLLGIFRPGPIFDDKKGPIKKNLRILGSNYGLGFGTGRNFMPFIHAEDVAEAILLWVKDGKSNEIFNIVPDYEIKYKEWFKLYGRVQGVKIKPLFIRGYILRLMAVLATYLKRALGKPGKVDVSYIIASATRNLKYSNAKATRMLGWECSNTKKYMNAAKL